ncbi:C40 family peptidase [Paenibacillus solisilvae]|uniref:C40 family peptidase n=1 Tax=Paenibacillus solisilvae TaxID=2486751 RepID=A0ABW0VYR8_9BACL
MQMNRLLKNVVNVSLCATIGLTALALGTAAPAHAATKTTRELIKFGEKYLGTPYKLGVVSMSTNAFDCSSFTQYVFDKFNVSLARTSILQATEGTKVPKGYLSMGDLVFFNTNGRSISHVAIYAGNNKILHSSNKGVNIADMNSKYWKSKFVTARRVVKS